MKRLVILLIVLIVLGGVVFAFGWIQIRIPADGYGVIFTRTNGWETSVVTPGTFVWRWQRLLPTNLSLYVFEPGTHRTDVRLEGTLPSASVIRSLLETPGEFDYDLRVTVQSRIRPESLPSLARDSDLRPDDTGTFYEQTDARIASLAREALLGLVERSPEALTLDQAYSSIVDEIEERLESTLSDLDVIEVTPSRIELPDVELYLAARDLATGVLEARAQAQREAARELARNQEQTDSSLGLLERYGEILDRYPVLLEYFRVGQEIEGDPLNLQGIIPDPQR